MKYILTFLLLLSFSAYAQQDTTLIYRSAMYVKDPVRSKWQPVVTRNGDLYKVSFYDKKRILQEVIHYEDEDLKVRKGLYQWYNSKGLGLLIEGNYEKGYKHGKWISYNVQDTEPKVSIVEQYNYGKLHDKYLTYWANKQIKNEGQYENGRKIGEWKMYYENGKLAGTEIYDVYGKKTTSEYYFEDGNQAKLSDLESPPTFEGEMNSFYSYLASSIKYPSEAFKNRISGTVYLSFTVELDGKLSDIKVEKSPDDDLSDEAIRVLSKSPRWIPGKQFGKPVRVKYNIPIKFSLPK